MSIAIPITDEEWKIASKIKNNQDLFNFLSRPLVAKEVLPVKKIHQVEFIVKP